MLIASEAQLEAVKEAFEDNFTQRRELGASLSIWKQGREVLSLHQGWCEREQERPWTEETLAVVWSSTKGPASACVLRALDESGGGLETPVGEVWPALRTGRLTMGQLLSHQGGLAVLDEAASVFDYPAVVRALEGQAPHWQPPRHGYHPRTFGFLLDEVVRRLAGGESLASYWQRNFAAPLRLDFWIGLPEAEEPRVARLYPGRMPGRAEETALYTEFIQAHGDPASLTARAFASPRGLGGVQEMNQPRVWRAEFPGFGGIGSARSLGKFYAMMAQGGFWQGQRYLSEKVLRWMRTALTNGPDEVLKLPASFTAGLMKDPLGRDGRKSRLTFGPSTSAFGHPGAGGSLGFADPENGLAYAYVMNQMEFGILPGQKSNAMVRALYGLAG
ncbi:MAG: serine hydrolase domain-containing protein [Verrucomicrobiota bacterium]